MPAPNSTPSLKKLYAQAGLDPGQVSGWADQQAGLLGQYGDTVALLKTDRARMRQALNQTKRDINLQKRTDFRSVVGAANDRGVLGSSSDVDARKEVLSGAAAQKLAANNEFSQSLIQNRTQLTQAQRDLMMGLSSLQGQRAAARAAAGNNAYLQKLLDDLVNQQNNGGGGGGGAAGGGGLNAANRGRWLRKLAGAGGIYGVANRIESLAGGLFDVSELEKGGTSINSGHSPGSKHYEGLAFDVNVTRNNNTPFETKKLKALASVLQQLYGKYQNESYGKWNDPKGHPTHFHWAAEMRRWRERQRRQQQYPGTGTAGGPQTP